MSDRRARAHLAAALAALALLAPRVSAAQTLGELRSRTVQAAHAANVARDTLLGLTKRASEPLPPDSFAVGGIVVRFNADSVNGGPRTAMERGATLAWTEISAFLGPGAAFRESPIIAHYVNHGGLVPATLVLSLAGSPGRRAEIAFPTRARWVATSVEDLVGSLAATKVQAALDHWSEAWVPVHRLDETAWANAAIDLATSNSAATRACYAGSVAQCESALGLSIVRDSLAEWYSPEDWRVLASSWQPALLDIPAQHARHDCVEARVYATCERIARARTIPLPLTTWTRQTLYEFAVARGGEGAFGRLLAARGSTLAALSAAAQIGGDSLVARWRVRAISAMPHSTSPSGFEFALAFGWIALFAMAATRSPRCG